MGNEEFLRICKAKVAEYTNSHMDKTDGKQITVYQPESYAAIAKNKSTADNQKAFHTG